MPDCLMPFPKDWHEFLKDYSFDDSQEVYTNGSRLIPVFRVEQLIEHLLKAQEPIEARLNLCESCTKEYAECEADKTDLVYGSGVGNDNIIGCPWYTNRWKAQEPRIVTEADFDGADEYGYIPAWTEEKDGDMYWECIPKAAITDPDGIGVLRYWTSRPTDEQREATAWKT